MMTPELIRKCVKSDPIDPAIKPDLSAAKVRMVFADAIRTFAALRSGFSNRIFDAVIIELHGDRSRGAS